MKCLNCGLEITDKNRQTYKMGINLPYCKSCTDSYNKIPKAKETARIVSQMSVKQKKKAHKIAKRKLMHNLGLTEDEANMELERQGL